MKTIDEIITDNMKDDEFSTWFNQEKDKVQRECNMSHGMRQSVYVVRNNTKVTPNKPALEYISQGNGELSNNYYYIDGYTGKTIGIVKDKGTLERIRSMAPMPMTFR